MLAQLESDLGAAGENKVLGSAILITRAVNVTAVCRVWPKHSGTSNTSVRCGVLPVNVGYQCWL